MSEILKSAGFSVSAPQRSLPNKTSRLFTVELTPTSQRRLDPARQTAVRPMTLSLRALRERVGRTQGDVARRVSMTQSQLSRVEARRDHLTSTLRKYVRALGGRIEVVAVVKGRRIVLQNV